MSQKEKVFTRKQLLVIFKIAFLEAMALSLIIPTISSTGETQVNPDCSNNIPAIIQCGNWSCTTAIGGIRCTKTITFSPAFKAPPKVYVNLNPGIAGTGPTTTYSNVQFMATTSLGQTWTVPANLAEVFNDTQGQHELYIDMSLASAVRLTVVCPSTPTIDTVFLTEQFSYDNGLTWHFVFVSTHTFQFDGNNVANGGIGDCGATGSGDVMENQPIGGNFNSLSPNINVSTPHLNNLLFRFVTFCDLGCTPGIDIVTLTQIKMEIQTSGIINPNNDVLSFFFAATATQISKTQFIVSANIVGFCGCAASQRTMTGNYTAITS